MQHLGGPAAIVRKVDRAEVVLRRQCDAGHAVRAQQRHVDQVLRLGHLPRKVSDGQFPFGKPDRVRRVRRGGHAAAQVVVGANQKLHRLELGIGIRPDPRVDGLTDVANASDIVNHDVLAPHPGLLDQFRDQGYDGLRARQAVLRRPGRPPVPPGRLAARGRHGAPLRGPVLIAVDLDRDSLPWTIPDTPQTVRIVETAEERVPRLPLVLSSSQIPDSPGSQAVDHCLVGVGVIPPVARHTVPTGGVRVTHPHHSAGVYPLAGAHGMVGLLAGFEGLGRRHPPALLRHRRP